MLSDEGVLVCDDIKTEEMESALKSYFNFQKITNDKGFFIGYLDEKLSLF